MVIVAEPGVTLTASSGPALRIEANVRIDRLIVVGNPDSLASPTIEVVRGRLEMNDCEIIGRNVAGLWVNGTERFDGRSPWPYGLRLHL